MSWWNLSPFIEIMNRDSYSRTNQNGKMGVPFAEKGVNSMFHTQSFGSYINKTMLCQDVYVSYMCIWKYLSICLVPLSMDVAHMCARK